MTRKDVPSFYEVRPGLAALRYLVTFSFLTYLSARPRPMRMFVELASTIDRHILSEGMFEKGVIAALEKVIADTGATRMMVDVGANIGNHTVALSHLFDRVEAVEPHPILFRVLEANVLWNKRTNVTCHNVGLGATAGTATLEESGKEQSISRVRERSVLPPETFGLSSAAFGNSYAIELKDAHEFFSGFTEDLSRAFIKIDVEGMEQEIIESILPLLREHRPLLGFELFTKAQPDLARMVSGIPGYELLAIRMHDVGTNKLWRALKLLFTGRYYTLEPVDLEHLDDVYPLMLLVPKNVQ